MTKTEMILKLRSARDNPPRDLEAWKIELYRETMERGIAEIERLPDGFEQPSIH